VLLVGDDKENVWPRVRRGREVGEKDSQSEKNADYSKTAVEASVAAVYDRRLSVLRRTSAVIDRRYSDSRAWESFHESS
jgi:hypothetical protein